MEVPPTLHFHRGLADPQSGTAGTILRRDDRRGFRFCQQEVMGRRSIRKQHIRRRHCRAQTALAASTPSVRHSSKTLASAFSVSICRRGPVPTTSLASVTMIRQASLLFATSYRGLLRRILRTSGLLAALTDRPSASPQCRRLWSDVLAESYFARSMRANRAPGLGLRDEASVRRTQDGMISRLGEGQSS
jgi:hypothetical protein